MSLAIATLCLHCHKLTAQPAPRPTSVQVAETIYDSGLKTGWQDWGWGRHDLAHGAARVDLSQYGGWILHHDASSTRYGALSFNMLAPAAHGKDFLEVRLANGNDDKSLPAIALSANHARKLPGGWLEFYVPWAELNPSGAPFDRIVLHARSAVGTDWVQFDKIVLTRFDAKAAAASPAGPATTVKLTVNCRAPGHAISPYIYGIAGDLGDPIPATARRWGGNPMTRYNWQNNANNVGKDWFFHNGKTYDYRAFLASNRSLNSLSALTIPIIGQVAKDTTSYGFPVAKYGAQKEHDPHVVDAGNGIRPDGTLLPPLSPTVTSVPAGPEMIQKWVETIVAQDASTKTRSVGLYILDNEPNLWNTNHRDVHPDPLSYDELLDRTIRYGTAIRKADPGARIAGPAEWGWTGYFYSAKDAAAGTTLRPDRRAHGDMPLVPWYLKQLHEHEKKTGTRVLDVLDVHYYPQAKDVYGKASDPATAALRLRSTRSLWDPTYKDESWINDNVRLLPRLKEWIAQNYPGLGVSIGEYNFGGEDHISGALALAEALGRFGVEGIDYAFYWYAPPKGSPAAWAFRAYRDFDGKGGQFLDKSLDTRMTSTTSLFASRDQSGKHLVLIALNLDPTTTAQAKINLDGCAAIERRTKYAYAAGAQSLTNEGEKSGGGKAALDETLVPYSLNVFDIWLK
ncbi:MAG TPA: glycoside hydrolase family 44 protein [Polyangiaceae bacterium]|nr:glycoside hydrolase family 44 protein [Polyangiaceae bacterium]